MAYTDSKLDKQPKDLVAGELPEDETITAHASVQSSVAVRATPVPLPSIRRALQASGRKMATPIADSKLNRVAKKVGRDLIAKRAFVHKQFLYGNDSVDGSYACPIPTPEPSSVVEPKRLNPRHQEMLNRMIEMNAEHRAIIPTSGLNIIKSYTVTD